MTNDKQQTALEWYIEQHNILAKISDNLSHGEIVKRISDIEKQAKEREREQHLKTWSNGWVNGDISVDNYESVAENYYNETYGGNRL
jgi:hypothetical protein